MKKFVSCVLFTFSLLVSAQTTYENAMNSALSDFDSIKTIEDFTPVIHQFERIAQKENTKWQPLYYIILTETLKGFYLPKDEAFQLLEKIEADFSKLNDLVQNDETAVLKGLFQTLKVAKDPMTYGPTLSSEIMQTYAKAIQENPNNPRAWAQMAEFEMGGAKFWGKDPKTSCPKVEKALKLFKKEKNN